MPKGRLFVVDSESLEMTIKTNVVSIKTPEPTGKQWLKTVADIMADMLQIEIGDYIFLWKTGSNYQKSRIYGVYRAISEPYYKMNTANDLFPFKIKIEQAYIFNNPLVEYDLLNCPYIKTTMWTVLGKKVAGKSRGTSPLSPDEVGKIITLLIGRNPEYKFIEPSEERVVKVEEPLRIDYSNIGSNRQPESLIELYPNRLNFFKSNYEIYYEKILETVFNQELTRKNDKLFKQIGVNVEKIIWYSNYLPYSIEQSEMDYLMIESEDGYNPSHYYLLEFMKNKIDESHIRRCLMYSKWIDNTLALGEKITTPIIICQKCPDFNSANKKVKELNDIISEYEHEYNTKELKVYIYSFSADGPQFVLKR